MNENCIESYIDIQGNLNTRKRYQKIRLKTYAGFKFLFDRFCAIFGLIILSPLIILIAIAIKLDSDGPVFFKQKRTGKNGIEFTMCKFRTMVASNDVYNFKKADEHTRVGTFLRKTSLDEIPQLFSIAIGQMSFIGPRPWIPDYFHNMTETQKARYCVRPGLTGLAQVQGRNEITIFDKIRYDLKYVENYSFSQDIIIIFLTIKAVLTARGADAGKHTIKEEISNLKNHKLLTSEVKPKKKKKKRKRKK